MQVLVPELYLACGDEGLSLGAHVVAEHLLVGARPLPVTRLYHELRGEDVGKLRSIAVATACDLQVPQDSIAQHAIMPPGQTLESCMSPVDIHQ